MTTNNQTSEQGQLNAIKRILVLGDWVVDDHWVTGVHRSPTSSRTGHQHFRGLPLPDSAVRSLGIAGRTASVLHRTKADQKDFCDVICVGLWHRDDTSTLAAMLDPSANKAQTPYRIVQPKLEIPERAKFFNLSDALAGRAGSIGKGHVYGTTRVIRIYQNIGTKIDLIQRIDWELRPPSPHNVWVTDREVLESFGLKDYLRSNKIDAVVVKDIRKGVVSP